MEECVIRILVIEDDREDYLLTKDYLLQIKDTIYQVDWEPEYCDALDRISQKEHDVYIVDYNLGTNSGLDLVRQSINSGITRPFIFLTGMDDMSIDREAMMVGATDYLIKGRINADVLERSIRYAIRQKRTEYDLKEANSTKDKLFSIISHDLRSPLATLMSSLELMTQDDDAIDPEMKSKILKELSKSSKSTFNLLENLLSWSRSQIGALTIRPEVFDITALVDEVILLFKSQANLKSISLVSTLSCNTLAHADKNMIDLVVRNLISNALKFTHEMGQITVGADILDETLEIFVSDNGIGMDKETVEALLFPDFFKTTRGTNNESGSGLGLKIVNEYITKSNGQLWVESEPNVGTTFFFTLPAVKHNNLVAKNLD